MNLNITEENETKQQISTCKQQGNVKMSIRQKRKSEEESTISVP